MPSITLIQLTDTHLLADPSAQLRGCNTLASLQTVLDAVHNLAQTTAIDGLLLTGDLADEGSAIAYQQLKQAIAPFPYPVYWLPGNHDDPIVMQRELQGETWLGPDPEVRAVDLGPWMLVLLNSVRPHATVGEGELSEAGLRSLQDTLILHRHKPILVALHHHPIPTGIDWMDQMQVQNAEPFLTILARFPQVKLVVFGHIHLELHQQHCIQDSPQDNPLKNAPGKPSRLEFYGTPSTCLQVLPDSPLPHHHLPGFRRLCLHTNGHYHTEVVRVDSRNA